MARDDLAAFKRRMVRLKKNVRQHVAPAVEKGADEFVAMAKLAVPVDEGDTRDSIRIEDRDELGATVKAGGKQAPHAHFVEWGTQKKPAVPFFFSSFRLVRNRIVGRVRRAVAKSVKEAFNG